MIQTFALPSRRLRRDFIKPRTVKLPDAMHHSQHEHGVTCDTENDAIAAETEVLVPSSQPFVFRNRRTAFRKRLEGSDHAFEPRDEPLGGRRIVKGDEGPDLLEIPLGCLRNFNRVLGGHA